MVAAFTRTAMCLPVFFLTCNFGELVTSAFENLEVPFYNLSWHLIPIEQQRFVMLVLNAIQKPVVIKGLFALDCSRATFNKVSLAGTGLPSAKYYFEIFRFR